MSMPGGSYLQYATRAKSRYFYTPRHGKTGPIIRAMTLLSLVMLG
jgi:hypothetical protein